MGTFAVLVVVILFFAAPPGSDEASRRHLPGLLWIAFTFASILSLNRAFALELENEALSGLALAPADRGFIFLGKALASFVLLVLVQAATALVFGLAFGVDLVPFLGSFALVAGLGALGLSLLGTLFGAMAVRTSYREVMLPLLMLPLMLPVLLGAVQATTALLTSGTLPFAPVQLLLVADAIYGIVAYLGFEAVLDE